MTLFDRLFRLGRNLAVATLCILVGAAAAQAQAPLPKVKIGIFPKVKIGIFSGILLAPEIAVENGYFKDEGLDAELVFLQAGPALLGATANGSVDVSYGDAVAWAAAVGNGFTNLKIIYPGIIASRKNQHQMHILARPGIKSVSELAGKTVGLIPTPLMAIAAKLWLIENKVDPASVKFVSVADGVQGPALQNGSVDAALSRNTATNIRLVKDYNAVDLGAPFDSLAVGTNPTAYYASQTWLTRNPEIAVKVARVLRRAANFYNTSTSAQKAAIASKYIGVNYLDIEAKAPGTIAQIPWDDYSEGPLTVKLTQHLIDEAVKHGVIAKSVDISAYTQPTAIAAELP